MQDIYEFDRGIIKNRGCRYLLGIDEAGRGPLAGPVAIGAVVLDLNNPIAEINDSKKLSEKKRIYLFKKIVEKAIFKKVVTLSAKDIDEINILKATFKGMAECVKSYPSIQDIHVLIDGNRPIPSIDSFKQECIVKGDAKSASVAAASILAKVSRDQIMKKLSTLYPGYGFEKHKGYGTKTHIEAIKRLGISGVHRKTFCKNL